MKINKKILMVLAGSLVLAGCQLSNKSGRGLEFGSKGTDVPMEQASQTKSSLDDKEKVVDQRLQQVEDSLGDVDRSFNDKPISLE